MGHGLGQTGATKSNHQQKYRKRKQSHGNSMNFRGFGTPWGIRTPGLLVRSLSEEAKRMLSSPFGGIRSGFWHSGMLSVPLSPHRNFPFWVSLWVSAANRPHHPQATIRPSSIRTTLSALWAISGLWVIITMVW